MGLALGYTNGELSSRLKVSEKTVESYRARLRLKLGLPRRSDIVRHALDQRLIGPSK